MRITLETKELQNLLTGKEKMFVKRPMHDEIALVISGSGLLITTLLSDFAILEVFSASTALVAKTVLVTASLALLVWSALRLYSAWSNPYSTDDLYSDIAALKLNPFVIYLIADEWKEFPNRYLFAYNPRWDGFLLPNHASSWVSPRQSTPSSLESLMNDLGLKADDQVGLHYLTTRSLVQYSFSENREKHYEFSFYYVDIDEFPAHLKDHGDDGIVEFGGRSYRWMTIDEAFQDAETYRRNPEVLETLRKEADEAVRFMQYEKRMSGSL